MKADNFDLDFLLAMRHSPVKNYIVPGMTSWLIGNPSEQGTIRLFDCSRDQVESITPHNHRFDLQCWVLRGRVVNRIWTEVKIDHPGDLYKATEIAYRGEPGKYDRLDDYVSRFAFDDTCHTAGHCYSMKADVIHSITFYRDTLLLVFEGPRLVDYSTILEPVVDHETIPTFRVEPWMFKKPTKE